MNKMFSPMASQVDIDNSMLDFDSKSGGTSCWYCTVIACILSVMSDLPSYPSRYSTDVMSSGTATLEVHFNRFKPVLSVSMEIFVARCGVCVQISSSCECLNLLHAYVCSVGICIVDGSRPGTFSEQ